MSRSLIEQRSLGKARRAVCAPSTMAMANRSRPRGSRTISYVCLRRNLSRSTSPVRRKLITSSLSPGRLPGMGASSGGGEGGVPSAGRDASLAAIAAAVALVGASVVGLAGTVSGASAAGAWLLPMTRFAPPAPPVACAPPPLSRSCIVGALCLTAASGAPA